MDLSTSKGVVLVIIDKLEWQCLIPLEEFNEKFTVDKEHAECHINKNKLDNPYMKADYYLQSYCLGHARCNIKLGDINVRLLGIYKLYL